ncbi:DNA ligase [Geomonas limicola]|uniref:DNA ligase (NAD(+)) n=1 Tax=Geomonas limicola TaxID=2740186 RepID=A0A6V8NDX9_9BACT|nr:hypothetical protein [Geomonas limicola]GFO70761.1 DNA ligase [Geomonas limicola]
MSRRVCLLLLAGSLTFTTACAEEAACPKVPPPAAEAELHRLRSAVKHHDELYYQALDPELSDGEYDALVAELRRGEACFPRLAEGRSLNNSVGSDLAAGSELIAHPHPMLSLNAATGPQAVEELWGRIVATEAVPWVLVQPKVDGLPVELTYRAGQLVSAATRGDGRFGAEVTGRVRQIPGIPLHLNGAAPRLVVVRGEVYAERARYAALDERNSGAYATPRHFAAAILKAKWVTPDQVGALRLFPFELVQTEPDLRLGSDRQALELLAGWGFPVHRAFSRSAGSLGDVTALYREYLEGRERLPFAADGIVVKLDDLALRDRLGVGTRTPNWAAAWKFPPPSTISQVVAIEWQTGRSGRQTPVLRVAPMSLGGLEVKRVSLHTPGTLEKLGVRVGDRVEIVLVGDVIPEVRAVVAKGPRLADTAQISTALTPTACYRDAPGCREQFLARARYFTSRKTGLGIAGLGSGRLQQLVEAGLVADLPSLFRLQEKHLAGVPGFAARSAKSVVAALARARRPQPFRLLQALGIPGVGPASVRELSGSYRTLGEILEGNGKAGGPAALRVRSFFATPEGDELLRQFRELGCW